MSEDEVLDIDQLPDIESGKGIDLTEFEGKKYNIAEVVVIEYNTPYNEQGEFEEGLKRPVKALKIKTDVVTTVKNKEDENVDISASELFNLKQDVETKEWGRPTHENAHINKFTKLMKTSKLSELIGKPVMALITTDKKGNSFLGFKRA